MPRAWALSIKSRGTPMWKEMAAGLKAPVAANASGLKGGPVWLMTNGRSVRSRRVAHWCSSSGTERTAVPRLARQPAEAAATASSTSSHGPNGATRMGTSIPNLVQNGVLSFVPMRAILARCARLRIRQNR